MAVNWSLGVMPDIGGNALNAFRTGREEVRKEKHDLETLALRKEEIGVRRGEAEAKAQERKRSQMVTLAKLYAHAEKGPEQFAQAKSAAAQLFGPEVLAEVPEQFDPQWIGQQRMIAEAMAKDGDDAISGIARELQDAGYQPGTKAFSDAMRGVIQNKYASDYVDEAGNTRRRSALQLQPQAAGDDEWEVVQPGGGGGNVTGNFPGQ